MQQQTVLDVKYILYEPKVERNRKCFYKVRTKNDSDAAETSSHVKLKQYF